MSSRAVLDLLRQHLGDDAVELDDAGMPRALPGNTEAMAAVCALAHQRGLRVRIEGNGSWMPGDAWADFAVSTTRLGRPLAISADGLVASMGGGLMLEVLRRELDGSGAWLPLDPPGLPERTVGSIVATGTAGPLRHGYGTVRDQLLGYTLVAGDGAVHRFDSHGGAPSRLWTGVGTFGAFGVVSEVRFRLVPSPDARQLLLATGDRDSLTRQARALVEEGVAANALELISPAGPGAAWILALELAGPSQLVETETARARARSEVTWDRVAPDPAARWRSAVVIAPLSGAVTLRIGVLPDGLDEMLDLLAARLGGGIVTAGAGRGGLRWSGNPTVAALRELRHMCAVQEVPVTLERAPWEVRRLIGHFGAYHESPGLHDAAPDSTFAVVLEAAPN